VVIGALVVAAVACDDGSDAATTAGVRDTDVAVDEVDPPLEWAFAGSLSGALRQIVGWSDGFAAIRYPDADDWSPGDEPRELWYSGDGVDWEAAPTMPGFEQIYTLAGHDGDLFALTGDTSDPTSPQTLWHRSSGAQWETVLSHPRLEHIAIGAGRVITYQSYPFEVLGVHDAATLEQAGSGEIPELERPNSVPGPGAIREFPSGRVIGLDDGFLARVGWADTSFTDGDPVTWLLYSADGSNWSEHPSESAADVDIPYGVSTAPTFEGLNLLTTSRGSGNPAATRLLIDRWDQLADDVDPDGLTSSWITDTGIDLQPTAPATIESASATEHGFFDVTAGAIRHSLDGITWELVEAPPTWSVVVDQGRRGLAESSILDGADGLLAVGVHGHIESMVGLTNPSTDIWVTER
jgi:hypothetical protein